MATIKHSTSTELERFFATRGRKLLLSFYLRLWEFKRNLQLQKITRPSNINATQAHVLALIQKGTKNTAALMECTGLGRRTINQALLTLRNAGLVTMKGAGNKITYHSKGA